MNQKDSSWLIHSKKTETQRVLEFILYNAAIDNHSISKYDRKLELLRLV